MSQVVDAKQEPSSVGSDRAPELRLSLASGLTWGIRACDPPSALVLQALARTARLPPSAGASDRVLLMRDPSLTQTPDAPDGSETYDLLREAGAGTGTDMARACSVLAVRTPGALLLHGALVAKHGRGVILTGPGGYGKTTIARRLPAPWQALSDDATLVVRDPAGRFVAHPWPTWSRVVSNHCLESWDVPQWVPLDHIFCLGRSEGDAVEPVGQGTALCLLLASVEQIRSYLPAGYVDAAQRLRDLETASILVKSVPVAILRFSIAGPVWLAIEEALAAGARGCTVHR